jgi:hypothetical protein
VSPVTARLDEIARGLVAGHITEAEADRLADVADPVAGRAAVRFMAIGHEQHRVAS